MTHQSLTYRVQGHFTNGLHSSAGALTRDRKRPAGPGGSPQRIPMQVWENEGGRLVSAPSG